MPFLTDMLAQAAIEQKHGLFADFTMTEEEQYELHVAGLLHDCGKVTTPEYIVDKATKLETIYDRIHEVRMRFEVLKRDAEIDYLKASLPVVIPNNLNPIMTHAFSNLMMTSHLWRNVTSVVNLWPLNAWNVWIKSPRKRGYAPCLIV